MPLIFGSDFNAILWLKIWNPVVVYYGMFSFTQTLMLQFGSDYKEVKHFKAEFKKQLKKVQLIYSDVKIDASGRKTLLLKPSPTHIKKLNKELTKQC